jgi:hypothetical protein
MSQDRLPSPGVRRVRDVEATASRWTLGGGDSAGGGTRIIDALFPDGGAQEADLARNLLPMVIPD